MRRQNPMKAIWKLARRKPNMISLANGKVLLRLRCHFKHVAHETLFLIVECILRRPSFLFVPTSQDRLRSRVGGRRESGSRSRLAVFGLHFLSHIHLIHRRAQRTTTQDRIAIQQWSWASRSAEGGYDPYRILPLSSRSRLHHDARKLRRKHQVLQAAWRSWRSLSRR